MPEAFCLEAEGLRVGHGGQAVVEGVSFAVAPGSCWALLGANGSGKSTLLRALAGLSAPLSGQLRLGGAQLASLSMAERARRRSFVPQHLPADLAFSVAELLALGRHPHRGLWGPLDPAADGQATAAALKAMDLEALGHKALPQLSGGQRQRAYLAAALATEAPLILLDEPTAHLDVVHQLGLLRALEARRKARGEAVVLVLHDLNLAAQFADQLLVLGEGQVLAQGPVAQVLKPELLRRAFGVDMEVRTHPDSGRPYLLPGAPEARRRGLSAPLRAAGREVLHLVAGGSSGERLLPALHRLGYRLSVGAVNLLDGDEALARRLGADVVVEAPFSPMGAEAQRSLRERLAEAAVVVVADVAWGPGNLANLEAVAELPPGRELYLVASDLRERDFTDGRASALWQGLVAQGAQVMGEAELLAHLAP